MAVKFVTMDSAQSAEELQSRALCVSQVLRERGISNGDRVVLKAGNSVGFIAVLLALMHTGAAVVLVDPRQRGSDSARIARQARARLAVIDGDLPPVTGVDTVSVYELLAEAVGRAPLDERLNFASWSALPDALIMWTSGSTGEPKGIVKSGRGMLRNLERTIDRMGYGPDDVLMPLLPFSHQYGLSLVLIAWLAGSSLVVAPYGRLDRAVWMAGRAGATVVDATPATFGSLLNLVERRPALRADLDSVRMYCTGGAPLDPAAAARFTTTFGHPLLDGYGSSELGNIAFATSANPVGCGAVLPGVDVRIVGEGGIDLPAGTIGELLIRTPDALSGYLNSAGDFEEFTDEWYTTGDLGRFDESANLFVYGRKSAVHRLGYTLYPEIIEHRAAECGAPVKVVPLPDDRLGSRLVFVVEDPLDQQPEWWRARIDALLPDYERPNRVVVVSNFPLTPNGKPDRKALSGIAQRSGPEHAELAVATGV